MSNPLVNLSFPIPFDEIKAEHIEPAIQKLVAQCESRLEEIAALDGPRTWDNTMQALDSLTSNLDQAMSVVRHLKEAANTPAIRDAHASVEPSVIAFHSRLVLHEGLWRSIRDFAATPEAAALTGTRRRYLDKTISDFKRHGAELPPDKKKELEEIDVELGRLSTLFSDNVLDSTNAFEFVTSNESQLDGLPASAVIMARESAEMKGVRGWRFTLQAPSYLAVLTYMDDASIRERFYRANNSRASRVPFDNKGNLIRILELRKKKANLLGYADFADLALEDRMAANGKRAEEFLADLRRKTEPFFHKENEELLRFRKELEGPDAKPLEPWDTAYYAEKLRRARYDFDEEMLRPYFPLGRTVEGMFEIVRRLFGIQVIEKTSVPAWDPQVRFYEILDTDGSLLGAFYADWYPRENKRPGAWMDAFITGVPVSGGVYSPHLGLMCGNLTPPIGGKPALMTHQDVETIFHEFGHLLHHCLSRVEVRCLAGTSVAWDFVELPSQIMENWCWERESLNLISGHYETGAPLPDTLFEKMVRARTFRAANAQMRQLSFGVTDLAIHRHYDPVRDGDVLDYTRKIIAAFSPTPIHPDYAMINSFSHLFSSPMGYAAGYYSYKWAEVLDADAFTVFLKEGIFNESAGRRFRNLILARGDAEDPGQLFRDFVGRDPDSHALLTRAGLVAA
jgi:oligopeptidase A